MILCACIGFENVTELTRRETASRLTVGTLVNAAGMRRTECFTQSDYRLKKWFKTRVLLSVGVFTWVLASGEHCDGKCGPKDKVRHLSIRDEGNNLSTESLRKRWTNATRVLSNGFFKNKSADLLFLSINFLWLEVVDCPQLYTCNGSIGTRSQPRFAQ